jgi:hypothetical protein
MQKFIEDFNNWQDVLDTLEKGGMTDYARYPHIYFPWNLAKTHNDFNQLQKMLQKEPWIMAEALKNAREIPFRPLPYGEEIPKIQGQFNLGYVNYELAGSGLDPLDFTRGLFICGEIGSGKTYPVLRMIEQILKLPIEERGFNIIIIQVVKRDADFLIRNHPSLRVIEWPDIRYSMFGTEPWDNADANINTGISVFASINYLMSLTQPILKKAVRLCQSKGAPLTFTNIAGELDTAGSSLAKSGFKVQDSIFKIKARLSEFIDTGAVLDTPAGFEIDHFWAKEDVCLNLMDQTNDYIYATFITDLLLKLQRYHERTPSHPARLKTLFVIDECRSVFPAKKDFHDIDPDRLLERFITTARSSGIGRITITQEPQSVTSWLTDNSAFFLTFPIAGEAIEHLKRYQNLTDEQLAYIEKLPEKGTGIFRDRRFDRKYLVQVPGSLQITHISKEETQEIMFPFIKQLHDRINAKLKVAQAKPVKEYTENYLDEIRQVIWPETLKILQTSHERFWLHRTALMKATGTSPKKAAASFDWLLKNGFTAEVKCFTSATKTSLFYPITEKGHALLETPKSKRKPTPRLFKHTFYQHKVGVWLKKQGFKPFQEYSPPGEDRTFLTMTEDGQPIDYPSRVDVYAEQDGRKVGYEITLSFKNLGMNVYKCFIRLGLDELHIVCETSAAKGQAQKKVEDSDQLAIIRQHHGNDIHYRQISEFL